MNDETGNVTMQNIWLRLAHFYFVPGSAGMRANVLFNRIGLK